MSFKLPELPFAHDALEPHIDSRTMEIHNGKHHAGYTNKLNAAIEGTDLDGMSIEEVWLWNEYPERWGPDCGIDMIFSIRMKRCVQSKQSAFLANS